MVAAWIVVAFVIWATRPESFGNDDQRAPWIAWGLVSSVLVTGLVVTAAVLR
jgi:hypothetical protein